KAYNSAVLGSMTIPGSIDPVPSPLEDVASVVPIGSEVVVSSSPARVSDPPQANSAAAHIQAERPRLIRQTISGRGLLVKTSTRSFRMQVFGPSKRPAV